VAQLMQVLLTCDLDEGKEVEAVETVTFGTEGATYEIEMCQRHLDEYRNWMQDYVVHARKVGAGRRPRGRAGSGTSGRGRRRGRRGAPQDVPTIREWARANGYAVSTRGRISQEVREAYDAASR
jgi:hypothetical protein